jgi:hypothetical protein
MSCDLSPHFIAILFRIIEPVLFLGYQSEQHGGVWYVLFGSNPYHALSGKYLGGLCIKFLV